MFSQRPFLRHCMRFLRGVSSPQELASLRVIAPTFPPLPRGLGFAPAAPLSDARDSVAPTQGRAFPSASARSAPLALGLDCSRDVMLTASALAAIPAPRLTDEAAYEAWPIVTVGTDLWPTCWAGTRPLASLRAISRGARQWATRLRWGAQGRLATSPPMPPTPTRACCAIRILTSTPLRASPRGWWRRPLAAIAAVRLFATAPSARLRRGEALLPKTGRSSLAVCEALAEDGAKLMLTCCGLEDCYGVPLGRHTLERIADGRGIDHADPAAQADALLSSLAPARGPSARRVLEGKHPDSIYVECPHGFVHVAGPVEESVLRACALPDCVRDAVEWWEQFRPSAPVPSALLMPTCPPGQLFHPAALGLPPTGLAPAAFTAVPPSQPPPPRPMPVCSAWAPLSSLQPTAQLCHPADRVAGGLLQPDLLPHCRLRHHMHPPQDP